MLRAVILLLLSGVPSLLSNGKGLPFCCIMHTSYTSNLVNYIYIYIIRRLYCDVNKKKGLMQLLFLNFIARTIFQCFGSHVSGQWFTDVDSRHSSSLRVRNPVRSLMTSYATVRVEKMRGMREVILLLLWGVPFLLSSGNGFHSVGVADQLWKPS